MSLIIALRCTDGIVVASDTGMSLRSHSDPTDYISVYTKKIYNNGRYIFAIAGTVWINQKVKELADAVFGKADAIGAEAFEELLSGMALILKNDIERRSSTGIENVEEVKNSIAINMLIAYVDSEGKNRIWVADNYLKGRQVEEKFVVFAENDLAYMPLKEYEDKELTLKEGKLIAFKTIEDTIRACPMYLAGPIEIFTINKQGEINEISERERAQLEAAYETLRKRNFDLLSDVAANLSMMRTGTVEKVGRVEKSKTTN
ncbi:MAG: hypothetical protein QXR58_01500 [Candidatus Micrarchaeaceae archaeon]